MFSIMLLLSSNVKLLAQNYFSGYCKVENTRSVLIDYILSKLILNYYDN